MIQLPKWVLANPFPALHDFESLTVIDQTARIYGAMQTLINEYNAFADTVNNQLASFTEDEAEARSDFELHITKVMNQFRCDMEQYLKINLKDTAETIFVNGLTDGTIRIPVDEKLMNSGVPADAKATGNEIASRAQALANEIAVERARISTLTANSESSTEGNAELIDIRVDYEGNEHATAGEAVRAQASIWNVAFPKFPVTWKDGYYINGESGSEFDTESLSSTDYIDISEYAGLPIEVKCRIAATQGFAFYNSEKTFISGVSGNTDGAADRVPYMVTVPTDAHYFRMTAQTVYKNICYARMAPSVPEAYKQINNKIDCAFVPLTWEDGWYIRGETGATSDNASLAATDYIDISEYAGLPIEVKCRIVATQGLAFYNSEKNYISGVWGNALTVNANMVPYVVTVPDDAHYIRMTSSTSLYKSMCYLKPIPTVYDLVKKIESAKSSGRRVFDRKIAMFGDSITLGRDGNGTASTITPNTIPLTIGRMLGVVCDNYGVGSIGWRKTIDGVNAYEKLSSVNLAEYDTIILCYGTNDHSETIGAWNSDDESTVMGQFHKCINYIYTQNQSARVIVIAPFNGRNVGSFPDFWYGDDDWGRIEECLKEACSYYWIPYISQKESPINAFTIQTLIGADGVHPSEEGYQRLGEWIAGEIRRLIG